MKSRQLAQAGATVGREGERRLAAEGVGSDGGRGGHGRLDGEGRSGG